MTSLRLSRVLVVCLLALLCAASAPAHPAHRQPAVAPYAPYAAMPDVVWPSWSPDGRTITYTTFFPPDRGKLYMVPAAGGSPRLFFRDEFSYFSSVWSPDGKRLAFTSNRSGSFQIWTASADGKDLKQVSTEGKYNVSPSWSPDGTQIAYASHPGWQPAGQICVVPAAGGAAKRVATGSMPTFSPDGRQIASVVYAAGFGLPTFTVHITDLESGASRTLASTKTTPDFNGPWPVPHWSPDGRTVLYASLAEGAWRISTVNVAEDKVERVIAVNGSAHTPAWSPDGKRIVFARWSSGETGRIATIDQDGRNQRYITDAQARTKARLVHYRSAGGLQIPAFLFVPSDTAIRRRPALIWLHGGVGGLLLDEFQPAIKYFVDQGFVVLAPVYRTSGGFAPELAKLAPKADILADVYGAADYIRELRQSGSAAVERGNAPASRKNAAGPTAHERQGAREPPIAIIGFSFGGFLAKLAASERPDLFAAVVDFFGVSDLAEVYRHAPMYRPVLNAVFGGPPDGREDVYRAASPLYTLTRPESDTPLLMLCGAKDELAYAQTVALAEALKKAGKDYEFISYPDAGHGFRGKDNSDAMEQALRFLSARVANGNSNP